MAIFSRRAGLLDGFAWFVPCSVCGNHCGFTKNVVGVVWAWASARPKEIPDFGMLEFQLCARKLRTCGLAAEGRAVVMDTGPGCILWIRRRCSFAWLFGGAGDLLASGGSSPSILVLWESEVSGPLA